MSPTIPFRRRSSLPSLPIVLGAVAAAVIGFAATMTFLNWQSGPGAEQTRVKILRPSPTQSAQIEVIDGDTVRSNGVVYRVVGIVATRRVATMNAAALKQRQSNYAPSLPAAMPT